MHVEAISNGLGAPSVYMVYLATLGKINAKVSITADTGSELDRVWSTGERTTAREYFQRIVVPLCGRSGIEPLFVRTLDKDGNALPALTDSLEAKAIRFAAGDRALSFDVPIFGSDGGRLNQTCTSKWKIGAIRQELRRMGATSARCAQGLHAGEMRRMKGANRRLDGGYWTYNDMDGKDVIQWASHYYPLVDLRLYRQDIRAALTEAGIPYLESSECDLCPHKDRTRWLRTSDDVIERGAAIEANFGGEFFFTSQRRPLKEVVAGMRAQSEMFSNDDDGPDFGCGNAVCDV